MAYTSNSEFDAETRVQKTNEVRPLDIYEGVHSTLKRDIWKWLLGWTDVTTGITYDTSREEDPTYNFTDDDYPAKIVNGRPAPEYGPDHTKEVWNPEIKDVWGEVIGEGYETKPATNQTRLEIDGTLLPEHDLFLHEIYRYLENIYPDHPDWLDLLTHNEIIDAFENAAAMVDYKPDDKFFQLVAQNMENIGNLDIIDEENYHNYEIEEFKLLLRNLTNNSFRRKFYGASDGLKMFASGVGELASLFPIGEYLPLEPKKVDEHTEEIDIFDPNFKKPFRIVDWTGKSRDLPQQKDDLFDFMSYTTPGNTKTLIEAHNPSEKEPLSESIVPDLTTRSFFKSPYGDYTLYFKESSTKNFKEIYKIDNNTEDPLIKEALPPTEIKVEIAQKSPIVYDTLVKYNDISFDEIITAKLTEENLNFRNIKLIENQVKSEWGKEVTKETAKEMYFPTAAISSTLVNLLSAALTCRSDKDIKEFKYTINSKDNGIILEPKEMLKLYNPKENLALVKDRFNFSSEGTHLVPEKFTPSSDYIFNQKSIFSSRQADLTKSYQVYQYLGLSKGTLELKCDNYYETEEVKENPIIIGGNIDWNTSNQAWTSTSLYGLVIKTSQNKKAIVYCSLLPTWATNTIEVQATSIKARIENIPETLENELIDFIYYRKDNEKNDQDFFDRLHVSGYDDLNKNLENLYEEIKVTDDFSYNDFTIGKGSKVEKIIKIDPNHIMTDKQGEISHIEYSFDKGIPNSAEITSFNIGSNYIVPLYEVLNDLATTLYNLKPSQITEQNISANNFENFYNLNKLSLTLSNLEEEPNKVTAYIPVAKDTLLAKEIREGKFFNIIGDTQWNQFYKKITQDNLVISTSKPTPIMIQCERDPDTNNDLALATLIFTGDENIRRFETITVGDTVEGNGLPNNTFVIQKGKNEVILSNIAPKAGNLVYKFNCAVNAYPTDISEDFITYKQRLRDEGSLVDTSPFKNGLWGSDEWPHVSHAYIDGLVDPQNFTPVNPRVTADEIYKHKILPKEKNTKKVPLSSVVIGSKMFYELNLNKTLVVPNRKNSKISLMNVEWLDYFDNNLNNISQATKNTNVGTNLMLQTDITGFFTRRENAKYTDDDLMLKFQTFSYSESTVPCYLQLGKGGSGYDSYFISPSLTQKPTVYGAAFFDSDNLNASSKEASESYGKRFVYTRNDIERTKSSQALNQVEDPIFELPLGEYEVLKNCEVPTEVTRSGAGSSKMDIISTSICKQTYEDLTSIQEEDKIQIINDTYISQKITDELNWKGETTIEKINSPILTNNEYMSLPKGGKLLVNDSEIEYLNSSIILPGDKENKVYTLVFGGITFDFSDKEKNNGKAIALHTEKIVGNEEDEKSVVVPLYKITSDFNVDDIKKNFAMTILGREFTSEKTTIEGLFDKPDNSFDGMIKYNNEKVGFKIDFGTSKVTIGENEKTFKYKDDMHFELGDEIFTATSAFNWDTSFDFNLFNSVIHACGVQGYAISGYPTLKSYYELIENCKNKLGKSLPVIAVPSIKDSAIDINYYLLDFTTDMINGLPKKYKLCESLFNTSIIFSTIDPDNLDSELAFFDGTYTQGQIPSYESGKLSYNKITQINTIFDKPLQYINHVKLPRGYITDGSYNIEITIDPKFLADGILLKEENGKLIEDIPVTFNISKSRILHYEDYTEKDGVRTLNKEFFYTVSDVYTEDENGKYKLDITKKDCKIKLIFQEQKFFKDASFLECKYNKRAKIDGNGEEYYLTPIPGSSWNVSQYTNKDRILAYKEIFQPVSYIPDLEPTVFSNHGEINGEIIGIKPDKTLVVSNFRNGESLANSDISDFSLLTNKFNIREFNTDLISSEELALLETLRQRAKDQGLIKAEDKNTKKEAEALQKVASSSEEKDLAKRQMMVIINTERNEINKSLKEENNFKLYDTIIKEPLSAKTITKSTRAEDNDYSFKFFKNNLIVEGSINPSIPNKVEIKNQEVLQKISSGDEIIEIAPISPSNLNNRKSIKILNDDFIVPQKVIYEDHLLVLAGLDSTNLYVYLKKVNIKNIDSLNFKNKEILVFENICGKTEINDVSIQDLSFDLDGNIMLSYSVKDTYHFKKINPEAQLHTKSRMLFTENTGFFEGYQSEEAKNFKKNNFSEKIVLANSDKTKFLVKEAKDLTIAEVSKNKISNERELFFKNNSAEYNNKTTFYTDRSCTPLFAIDNSRESDWPDGSSDFKEHTIKNVKEIVKGNLYSVTNTWDSYEIKNEPFKADVSKEKETANTRSHYTSNSDFEVLLDHNRLFVRYRDLNSGIKYWTDGVIPENTHQDDIKKLLDSTPIDNYKKEDENNPLYTGVSQLKVTILENEKIIAPAAKKVADETYNNSSIRKARHDFYSALTQRDERYKVWDSFCNKYEINLSNTFENESPFKQKNANEEYKLKYNSLYQEYYTQYKPSYIEKAIPIVIQDHYPEISKALTDQYIQNNKRTPVYTKPEIDTYNGYIDNKPIYYNGVNVSSAWYATKNIEDNAFSNKDIEIANSRNRYLKDSRTGHYITIGSGIGKHIGDELIPNNNDTDYKAWLERKRKYEKYISDKAIYDKNIKEFEINLSNALNNLKSFKEEKEDAKKIELYNKYGSKTVSSYFNTSSKQLTDEIEYKGLVTDYNNYNKEAKCFTSPEALSMNCPQPPEVVSEPGNRPYISIDYYTLKPHLETEPIYLVDSNNKAVLNWDTNSKPTTPTKDSYNFSIQEYIKDNSRKYAESHYNSDIQTKSKKLFDDDKKLGIQKEAVAFTVNKNYNICINDMNKKEEDVKYTESLINSSSYESMIADLEYDKNWEEDKIEVYTSGASFTHCFNGAKKTYNKRFIYPKDISFYNKDESKAFSPWNGRSEKALYDFNGFVQPNKDSNETLWDWAFANERKRLEAIYYTGYQLFLRDEVHLQAYEDYRFNLKSHESEAFTQYKDEKYKYETYLFDEFKSLVQSEIEDKTSDGHSFKVVDNKYKLPLRNIEEEIYVGYPSDSQDEDIIFTAKDPDPNSQTQLSDYLISQLYKDYIRYWLQYVVGITSTTEGNGTLLTSQVIGFNLLKEDQGSSTLAITTEVGRVFTLTISNDGNLNLTSDNFMAATMPDGCSFISDKSAEKSIIYMNTIATNNSKDSKPHEIINYTHYYFNIEKTINLGEKLVLTGYFKAIDDLEKEGYKGSTADKLELVNSGYMKDTVERPAVFYLNGGQIYIIPTPIESELNIEGKYRTNTTGVTVASVVGLKQNLVVTLKPLNTEKYYDEKFAYEKPSESQVLGTIVGPKYTSGPKESGELPPASMYNESLKTSAELEEQGFTGIKSLGSGIQIKVNNKLDDIIYWPKKGEGIINEESPDYGHYVFDYLYIGSPTFGKLPLISFVTDNAIELSNGLSIPTPGASSGERLDYLFAIKTAKSIENPFIAFTTLSENYFDGRDFKINNLNTEVFDESLADAVYSYRETLTTEEQKVNTEGYPAINEDEAKSFYSYTQKENGEVEGVPYTNGIGNKLYLCDSEGNYLKNGINIFEVFKFTKEVMDYSEVQNSFKVMIKPMLTNQRSTSQVIKYSRPIEITVDKAIVQGINNQDENNLFANIQIGNIELTDLIIFNTIQKEAIEVYADICKNQPKDLQKVYRDQYIESLIRDGESEETIKDVQEAFDSLDNILDFIIMYEGKFGSSVNPFKDWTERLSLVSKAKEEYYLKDAKYDVYLLKNRKYFSSKVLINYLSNFEVIAKKLKKGDLNFIINTDDYTITPNNENNKDFGPITGIYYPSEGYGGKPENKPWSGSYLPWDPSLPMAKTAWMSENLKNNNNEVLIVDEAGIPLCTENKKVIASKTPTNGSYESYLADQNDNGQTANDDHIITEESNVKFEIIKNNEVILSSPLSWKDDVLNNGDILTLKILSINDTPIPAEKVETESNNDIFKKYVVELKKEELKDFMPDRVYFHPKGLPLPPIYKDEQLFRKSNLYAYAQKPYLNDAQNYIYMCNENGEFIHYNITQDENGNNILDETSAKNSLDREALNYTPLYLTSEDWFKDSFYIKGNESNPFWQTIKIYPKFDQDMKKFIAKFSVYGAVKNVNKMELQEITDTKKWYFSPRNPTLRVKTPTKTIITPEASFMDLKAGKVSFYLSQPHDDHKKDKEVMEYGIIGYNPYYYVEDGKENGINAEIWSSDGKIKARSSLSVSYTVNTTEDFADPSNTDASIIQISELALLDKNKRVVAYATFPPIEYRSSSQHISFTCFINYLPCSDYKNIN